MCQSFDESKLTNLFVTQINGFVELIVVVFNVLFVVIDSGVVGVVLAVVGFVVIVFFLLTCGIR